MKTAFVLSGGGAKGSFQAGVIHQLVSEKKVTPDVLYGTSVGAINACVYSYIDSRALVDMWLGIQGPHEILYPTGWKRYLLWPRIFWKSGFYNLSPLRENLQELILGHVPHTMAYSCCVDLPTGNVEFISNLNSTPKDYLDSVISSSSIPLVMEAHNNKVDGGVRDHTPLERAIRDRCDRIYVIICKPIDRILPKWTPPQRGFSALKYGLRAIDDVMSHEIFMNDISLVSQYRDQIEFHVYAPDRYWADTLEFNPEKIPQAISAGILATELPLADVCI